MNIGVVVIGRNEGQRLCKCLQSVTTLIQDVVYVDSGSTDDSVEITRCLGIDIHELDPSQPFSAARARNEGFAYLLKRKPALEFVQFIDGDCELAANWLPAAYKALTTHIDYAAVVGHLQELHPEMSIYNRLCALEWASLPIGDITDSAGLGGISLIRATVFKQLNGFNPNVIAGEERELGVRIGLANYKIVKLNQKMAVHDADIHHFAQWWKRAVRSGHAVGQGAIMHGNSRKRNDLRRRNSIWFWGGGLPLLVLLTVLPTNSWSLFLLLGYPVLGIRIYRYCRTRRISQSDSLLYGCFMLIAKFAEAIGLLKFYQNSVFGNYKIIEYK